MSHLHEKRQLGIRGVRYVDDVDYAIPVRRRDVPEKLASAIEGNPVERTNKGVVLSKAPGTNCGCFGGFIEDNPIGECPWLYIFIPPEIPNPEAANYTSKRGHPPAKTIKNMTLARKRELRDLCAKVGWELNTEDLWEKPDSSGVEDQGDEGSLEKDVPGKDWTTLSNKGDDPQVRNFYKSMEEMRDSGWHSWMIAPEGNFDKPERWKVGLGQERAEADFRRKYYDRRENDVADDVVATYGSMKSGDDDFTGYGRVTESTKVTLTVGQLKRLVKEAKTAKLVKESDKPSSYIFTVVLYDIPSGGISTVSYKRRDDAVQYCMDHLEDELDPEDFADCEEKARARLESDGFYETGNTQFMVYDTMLIG